MHVHGRAQALERSELCPGAVADEVNVDFEVIAAFDTLFSHEVTTSLIPRKCHIVSGTGSCG